jgi:hypothetical protein
LRKITSVTINLEISVESLGFTVGGADHQGMPEEITFIYEGIGTDALSLAEVFE